jgi:acyl-CoA thioesterase-1
LPAGATAGKIPAMASRARPASTPRRAAPRRVVVLALLLAAGAAIIWWPRGRPALPPLDPGRDLVVFLGDSITGGHGLALEATFAHRLGAALGIPVRNAGISGDTTAGALARLERDVLAHRPKLTLVELGANDAFRRVPAAETLANLRDIVRRLRQAESGVIVLHVRMTALPGLSADPYREGFRAIARDEGAALFEDFLDGVVPGLTNDGLHPTAEGHARLAARLEPLLRKTLAR